jgi:hypothetical protein
MEFPKVPTDRARLMTAFKDAVGMIQDVLKKDESVSAQERRDAASALERARTIMERHEKMESFRVFQFFDDCDMDSEQSGRLLQILMQKDIAKCHQFLEVPVNVVEKLLSEKEGAPPIPYPFALRILRYVYHEFQQPAHPVKSRKEAQC